MSNDYLLAYAAQLDEGDGATVWEPFTFEDGQGE